MTDTVTFRPYQAADWEAVMAPLGIDRPIDYPRRADLRDVEGHYRPPSGAFLVGLAGRMIVIMGGFSRERDGVARLKRLRADPGFRRLGLARDPVGRLEGRAREAGYAELMLHVTEHQVAARAFYPRLGHELTHDRPGDQARDLYYRKVLAGPAGPFGDPRQPFPEPIYQQEIGRVAGFRLFMSVFM